MGGVNRTIMYIFVKTLKLTCLQYITLIINIFMKRILLSASLIATMSLTSVAEIIPGVSIGEFYYDLDTEAKTATVTREIGRKYITYEIQTLNLSTTVSYEGTGYLVKLGAGCFSNSPNLTTVNIPSGTISIPEYCFSNCKKLTMVNFPSSLDSISRGAFGNCSSLKNVSLPQGLVYLDGFNGTSISEITLPSSLRQISLAAPMFHNEPYGDGAFAGTPLKRINIPKGVKILGDFTFSKCSNLTEIILPEGLKHMGHMCFESCPISSINLPSTVETMQRAVFNRCSNLTGIVLPASLRELGWKAFDSCPLTSFEYPESLSVLRTRLFYNCKLAEFSVKPSVKEINPGCFYALKELKKFVIEDGAEPLVMNYTSKKYRQPDGCQESDMEGRWFDGSTKNLEELYIGRDITVDGWTPEPDSVSRAGDVASEDGNPFKDFKALKRLTIGENVTDASLIKISECENLQTIEIKAAVPPSIGQLTEAQKATVTLVVPEGQVEAYKSSAAWGGVSNIVASSPESSIEDITVDADSEVEYFNLQGVRVVNPASGIYIRRQGHKVEKVVL